MEREENRGRGLKGLLGLDPRLKIALALGFGLLAWRAGVAGLGAYGLCLAWLLWRLRASGAGHGLAVRGCLVFVAAWTAARFGLGLLEPDADASLAVARAGLLGARLAVLVGLGLCLARCDSPRRLGLAFSWFLLPVARGRAWRAALSLALVVHFIPLVWETLMQARRSLLLRGVPWRGRWVLLPQVALRALGRAAWTQAVAVAARGLDRAEAWNPAFEPQPLAWAVGAALLAAGWLLSLA